MVVLLHSNQAIEQYLYVVHFIKELKQQRRLPQRQRSKTKSLMSKNNRPARAF